ncbi:hypothetical protein EKN07_01935 [Actinobaculum sp. 352]|nr:hypothetical protein EKN07_01935 [Actinobaculum sp. 352]
MQTWAVSVPASLPGSAPEMSLYDSSSDSFRSIAARQPRLFACGITPYDATHLGHAFTYVSIDTLLRLWHAAGAEVRYAQNVTDIDDPLFERARDTGVDWRELADQEIALFREDMHALGVLPPDAWVAVSEKLDDLERVVRDLEARGLAYRVPGAGDTEDIYADLSADSRFVSAPVFRDLDLEKTFDAHGGDSTRSGKRHPLDPQLWKGVRGEDFRPSGGAPGDWRPGWHIECALIARDELGESITVQAGGSDLLFPHHEMSESHLRALTAGNGQVSVHMHVGMVGYAGEKMSKSLGNLVLVSQLRARGVDPRVIRLCLLAHHYREDWEYTDDELSTAHTRLQLWERALRMSSALPDDETSQAVVRRVWEALATDLNSPEALRTIDRWAENPTGGVAVESAITTLLGVEFPRAA